MYYLQPACDVDLSEAATSVEAALSVEGERRTIHLYLGPHRLILTPEQAAEVRVQLDKALEL